MKPTFRGKVENGKLILDRKDLFDHTLREFNNQQVLITVSKQFNKRSLQQNSYYWGVVLPTISLDTGHTVNELHEIFKRMFLPPNIVNFKDKEFKITGSTTKLSVGEFVEYIQRITAEAGQLGIHIPTPEEAGFMTE